MSVLGIQFTGGGRVYIKCQECKRLHINIENSQGEDFKAVPVCVVKDQLESQAGSWRIACNAGWQRLMKRTKQGRCPT